MNSALQNVINEGISLMGRHDLSAEMYKIWVDYSLNILNLISDNPMIKYEYTSILMNQTQSNNTLPIKLNKCIDYLINISPLIR